MYENINIKLDNCCVIDDMYYYIDINLNVLIVKSIGGKILFTYPLFLQLTTSPIKFDFDGVYFFSLHLEGSRNIIRKWKLVNYILDFIKEYDYSSIGLLANATTKFRKFFNMPIEHGDWSQSYHTNSNAYFVRDRDELIVENFRAYAGWSGPTLTKDFTPILDFKLESKFHFTRYNYSFLEATRVYLYLKESGTNASIFIAIFDANSAWLWDDGVYVYNNVTNYLIDGSYNYVELKRYDSQIELVLNGKVLYRASTNSKEVSRFHFLEYHYGYNLVDVFRINRFYLTGYTNDHIIDTDTLIIDSYKSSIKSYLPEGSNYVDLEGSTDYIENGTLLYLGDVNSNTYEEVTVTGILSPGIYGLNFFTYFEHVEEEIVNFSKNIYIFNNYRRKNPGGSIYKLDYTTGYVETTYDSDSYTDVTAGCFFNYKGTYLLGYVSITNFIMLEIHNELSLFEVMNIENVKADQITVIPITDVDIHNNELYRIQKSATYYSTDYSWTNYNYQLTPVMPFIDSTTIEAKPLIMNADGVSVIAVTALAKDQYAEPIVSIRTKFYDDDDVGYMTIQDTYTGFIGKAVSYYKSGIVPREVLLSTELIQE